MPPKGAAASRKRENMYFEPGVRGRKTGLTVPDTGIRDEMGMEPIDDLFSSPEKTVVMGPAAPAQPAMTAAVASARKPAPRKTPAPAKEQRQAPKQIEAPSLKAPEAKQQDTGAQRQNVDETNSYEESMQIGNSTMPEPTAVLTERRKSMHVPLPKSKSPTKTFLGSPARRHPSIQPISSPTRGEIVRDAGRVEKEPVARKLNFSNGDDVFAPTKLDAPKSQPEMAIPKSPAPASQMKAQIVKTPTATSGKRKRASLEKENRALVDVTPKDIPAPDSVRSVPGAWEEATPFPSQRKSDRSFDLSPTGLVDDDFQPMQMEEEGEQHFEQLLERTATPPEPEPAPKVVPAMKKPGRTSLEKQKESKKAKDKGKGKEVAVIEKKKVGRPKSREKEKEAVIPMAQAEQYLEIEASRIYSEDEAPALPPPKRSKLSSKDANRKISIKRAAQLAKDVESSPVQIQRGPPRPRQNGLFIMRRETPALGGFQTARVGLGRPSVKPAAYWQNKPAVYEEDDDQDQSLLDSQPIQQAVRRPSIDLDDDPRTDKHSKKSSQLEVEEEEEDLAEPWESEPGRIFGAVKEWSAHAKDSDATALERDDEIAFSGPAIITRPIPGSDVQFAKTLTLPFFGSGMVDLPPGAIKKHKNSRKMQMVFFVHRGNVKVSVNGNEFRIGAGGMWQVPRGNMYSIENDYGKEARIFFSQGCEVPKED